MSLTPAKVLKRREAEAAVPGFLALVALGALYRPLQFNLSRIPVFGSDNEGLGLLVPLLVLALAWQRRDVLRGLPGRPDARGWWLLCSGGLIVVVGHRLEMRLPLALSLPLVAAGALCLIKGWRWVSELWFPLLLLAAVTPLPAEATKAIAFPLQAAVARFSTLILGLSGMPIERSGVALATGGQSVLVSEGCSGWRSGTASFWLLLAMVYLQRPSRGWVWLACLPLTLAVGLAANVLRVVTVVAGAAFGQGWLLRSPWHELLGLVYFLPVAWLLVVLVTSRLSQETAAPAGSEGDAPATEAPPPPQGALWRLAAALWVFWGLTALSTRPAAAVAAPPPPPELPRSLGDWRRVGAQVPDTETAGEWLVQARYRNASGREARVLWQLPYGMQRRPHRAVNLWLKQGAELLQMESARIQGPARQVPVRVAILSLKGAPVAVVATHLHPHRAVASDTQARLWRLPEQLLRGTPLPWVTLEAASSDPESALELEERLLPLAEEWLARAASGGVSQPPSP